MSYLSRREFLKIFLSSGVALCGSNILTARELNTSGPIEERKKQNLAKYIFRFSSPYFTAEHQSTPHAHQEIKHLIEQYTHNKVYVDIQDGGSAGIGSVLANSVAFGETHGALLSFSNLSPKVPEIDIINIPFWAVENNDYIRLMYSKVFQKHVLSKLRKHNLQMLFPYVVGARTITSTKKYRKRIVTTSDFKRLQIRVPPSTVLKQMYKMVHASPVKMDWAVTAKAANLGRFEALDPSLVGLYSGPGGLKYQLGTVTELGTVHDGWLAIGNVDFIDHMDSTTRTQFLDAFVEIQAKQQLLQRKSKQYCSTELKKLGVEIYKPNVAEKDNLAAILGHGNPNWNATKSRLLGSNWMNIFDEMYRAAKG